MTRVALPVTETMTLAHFGIAPAYAVYDVTDGQVVAEQRRANPDPEHAATNHHKLVLDQVRDCQVVIAQHMGPPMVRSLEQLGILVLRAPSVDAGQSVQAYLREPHNLQRFTVEQAAPPPGHEPHDHDHNS
jgi:predicted Fe-Mo cluster-binding NifX family protein